MAGCCEHGDEPSTYDATESACVRVLYLEQQTRLRIIILL
jgi:hypothetical protein